MDSKQGQQEVHIVSRMNAFRSPGNAASLPLAAFFAIVLAVFGLAATASSAWAATITTPIAITDPSQAASGDGWKWEPSGSTGVLTLENADVQVDDLDGQDAAITVPDGATIYLKGENAIALRAGSPTEEEEVAAIYGKGDLVITGDASASAQVKAEGSRNLGIYCEGNLDIESAIKLDVSAASDANSRGICANGNLTIKDAATISAVGSEYGLYVVGSTDILDAGQIDFAAEDPSGNPTINPIAAFLQGGATISGTENVSINGSSLEAHDLLIVSDSTITIHATNSDCAINASKGLEITNGSYIAASSPGHVVDVNGGITVQNSTLRSESMGAWSTAIRVAGDFTVESSTVIALGDSECEHSHGILCTPLIMEEYAGNLILKGNPSLTAEGSDSAIQFTSDAKDSQNNHVTADPNIGATAGGMLSYAERMLDYDDLYAIWTYSTGEVSIDESGTILNASKRVDIGTENSVLFITDNDEPAVGLKGVKAIAADGSEYPAEEWLDGSHVGYYRFLEDLPEGTYTLDFGPGYETAGAAVIEVPDSGLSLYTMSFYSIAMEQADNIQSWLVQPSTGERVNSLEHVLYGATVKIGAQPDDSYRFIAYKASGTAPKWEGDDASRADQEIVVLGNATIVATATAVAPVDPTPADSNTGSTNSSGKISKLSSTGDPLEGTAILAVALAAPAALAIGIATVHLGRKR